MRPAENADEALRHELLIFLLKARCLANKTGQRGINGAAARVTGVLVGYNQVLLASAENMSVHMKFATGRRA